MITAIGVDIGSLTTKSVVLNETKIISTAVVRSSEETELSARATIEQALQQIGLSFDTGIKVVATGLGSKSVSFSQSKSLTACLAQGSKFAFSHRREWQSIWVRKVLRSSRLMNGVVLQTGKARTNVQPVPVFFWNRWQN